MNKEILEKKKENDFFSGFFFPKYKLCIVLKWFIAKIISSFQKYLFWDYLI